MAISHGHCIHRPMRWAGSSIRWRLEQFLSRPRPFLQVLAATGKTNQRRCTLTHEIVCWVVLAMGLLTDLPIRQVLAPCTPAPSRRGECPSIQPVCGPAKRGEVPPPVRARSFILWPGPIRPELVPRVPPGRHRWDRLRSPRLRRPTPRPSGPLGRARGDGASCPECGRADPGRIPDAHRTGLRGPGGSPRRTVRWSAACSAI